MLWRQRLPLDKIIEKKKTLVVIRWTTSSILVLLVLVSVMKSCGPTSSSVVSFSPVSVDGGNYLSAEFYVFREQSMRLRIVL